MACKKETVPFSGTPEQEAALKKGDRGTEGH